MVRALKEVSLMTVVPPVWLSYPGAWHPTLARASRPGPD